MMMVVVVLMLTMVMLANDGVYNNPRVPIPLFPIEN
jgi:hypothetical protein